MKRLTTQHLDVHVFPRFLGLFRRCRSTPPPPDAPPKGQLRLRSLPGAFVCVGILFVLIGLTVAVIGYWPNKSSSLSQATQPRQSVEKLKLIGPVIMGFGLFVFICANTLLYENRDMETRRLLQNRVVTRRPTDIAISTSNGVKMQSQNTWSDSSGELDNRRNILIRAQLLCPPINDLSVSLVSLRSDPCISSLPQLAGRLRHQENERCYSSDIRLNIGERTAKEAAAVPHRGTKCRSWPRLENGEENCPEVLVNTENELDGTRESSQETVPEVA